MASDCGTGTAGRVRSSPVRQPAACRQSDPARDVRLAPCSKGSSEVHHSADWSLPARWQIVQMTGWDRAISALSNRASSSAWPARTPREDGRVGAGRRAHALEVFAVDAQELHAAPDLPIDSPRVERVNALAAVPVREPVAEVVHIAKRFAFLHFDKDFELLRARNFANIWAFIRTDA